jgi:membrane associated rhomboid family serine protease
MLDDRSYMRPDYGSGPAAWLRMPVTVLLTIALIVAFVLQQIDIAYFHQRHLQYLELSPEGLRHGYIWQLLTFQFLHAGPMHLFGNLIGIWFCGRYVEERLGKAHFLKIYFLGGVTGGLLQSIAAWIFPMHFGGTVVGASAGVMASIAAFCLIDPEGVILAFFVLPIRAIYILYFELGISLLFTIVPSEPGIAWTAHLGGILFAIAYMRWGLNASRALSEWNPLQRKMRRERMIKAATVRAPLSKGRRRSELEDAQDVPSEEFISQQVDPILDKISAHGIQSLTPREREILQAARARMSKR